jgi:hypothetical protein
MLPKPLTADATQYFNRRTYRSAQHAHTHTYSMRLSGTFLRKFSFNLFIRRHQKSPKFGSVCEAEMLPPDTDKLNQKSECLRCIKIIVNSKFGFHHTCYCRLRRWRYGMSVIVKSLQPFEQSSFETFRRGNLCLVEGAETRDRVRGWTAC